VIGETIGNYKILARLGAGGMGEVYLAEHRYIARRAAIKFLLPELTGSTDVVNRFFAEARAASLIEHPGIVEVLDCDIHTDGRAFIVLELLNGESLRGYLERNGRMEGDPLGAMSICWQMTSALAAAHAQGIIHRDLKPDNAFLHVLPGRPPFEPTVKLLDFGIAKLHGEKGTSNTRSGQLLGTPLYMSPEQCRGVRQVDARSDIYSLGCIMFEIFCGRPPFVSEGFGDLIIAHVSNPPPDPRQFAPTINPKFYAALMRCLEKDPAARPASTAELSALIAAAGGEEVVRVQVPVQVSDHPKETRTQISSPVGWATPARVATTPFPHDRPGAAPQPKRGPGSSSPFNTPAKSGGTRLLPTPAPSMVGNMVGTSAPTTLGAGASEVYSLQPRRNPWKVMVVIASSLAAVAAIVFLALPGLNVDTKTKNRESSETREAEPPPRVVVAEEPPVPPPRPTPRPAAASVTIRGVPPEATIRLDGRSVSSPVSVPVGPEKHRLTVEIGGVERWAESVDGTADRDLVFKAKPDARPEIRPDSHAKTKSKHNKSERNNAPGFDGFTDL